MKRLVLYSVENHIQYVLCQQNLYDNTCMGIKLNFFKLTTYKIAFFNYNI